MYRHSQQPGPFPGYQHTAFDRHPGGFGGLGPLGAGLLGLGLGYIGGELLDNPGYGYGPGYPPGFGPGFGGGFGYGGFGPGYGGYGYPGAPSSGIGNYGYPGYWGGPF